MTRSRNKIAKAVMPENPTSYRDAHSKFDLSNKASVQCERVSGEQSLDILSSYDYLVIRTISSFL